MPFLAYVPNMFDFEGFEDGAEESICSYANCLKTVVSTMRNTDLAALQIGKMRATKSGDRQIHSRIIIPNPGATDCACGYGLINAFTG